MDILIAGYVRLLVEKQMVVGLFYLNIERELGLQLITMCFLLKF